MDRSDLEAALLLVPVHTLFFILLLPLVAYCLAKSGRKFRMCLSDLRP